MSSIVPRFEIPHSRFARAAASAVLPILIVLYPTLLLLEDLEPGFVRSVVNPHAFLLALLVAAIMGNRDSDSRTAGSPLPAPRLFVVGAAVVGGFWTWWRLDAGTLGIIVGLLAGVAIGVVALALTSESPID